MNRLIPRSWGENFVNIFLDLSNYISHFSSGIALINNSLSVDTPPLVTASATPMVAPAADRLISLSAPLVPPSLIVPVCHSLALGSESLQADSSICCSRTVGFSHRGSR